VIIPGNERETIRAGVVGVGHMGRYHVGAYSEILNVQITAVADSNVQRVNEVAAAYRAEAFTDYRDLFGKVDVVSVAVPTNLHHDITCDFLAHGIHVLVEKPISPTVPEAESMFELAKKKDLALCIGHVERFNGAVMEINKIVENPILVEIKRMGPFTGRGIEDGVVLDLMIHDLDIVLNLVSSPIKQISAFSSSVMSNYEDVAIVQIEFESGTLASLLASRVSEHKIRTMAVTQKDAYVFLDYSSQEILVYRRAASSYIRTPASLKYKQESFIERIFVHRENPLKAELVHFIQCSKEPECRAAIDIDRELLSLKAVLQVMEMIRNKN